MKLFRGLEARAIAPGGSVATIGNFDGVHRGHQALVSSLAERGREMNLPVVVVTFEPLPEEYFAPETAPARLTSLAEKLEALASAGAERVWVLRFNERLARLEPTEFVQRVLAEGAGARHVLVGDDFRFGHRRAGDLALLQEIGPEHGFEAAGMESFRLDGHRISSTAVREAIAAGDLARAETLLGRPYAICGRVVRGEQLGRRLGYPTANIRVERRPALEGVFAVEVDDGASLNRLPGVASLGTRPTVDGTRRLLEVHLFDFQGELYGRRLRVIFRQRLREERRFDSLEALTGQMRHDEQAAREILEDRRTG
jgi:riboflavin kinase/FMN adenylyltransferase